MKKLVLLTSTIMFLVSCTAQPLPMMVPATFTLTHVPTASVMANPVSTSMGSGISSPTSTETITSTPDSCRTTEKTWYTKHLSDAYFSNGQWGAVVCSDNGVYTRVSNVALNITWNVPSLDNELSDPEPTWYWEPYLWSEDGKYLYLQPVCLCFIDSPWLIYSSGFGLARLNLKMGEYKILLVPSDSGYSFEFTQDGNSLAFSPAYAYNVIQIRDLISDTEQNVYFQKENVILEFRWTPDGSRLVIFTQESAEDESKSGFSIFVYNVKDDVLKKLVEKNKLASSFPTKEYIEPRISISDLSNEVLFLSGVSEEIGFELNIRTGELVQVDKLTTPVATPQ